MGSSCAEAQGQICKGKLLKRNIIDFNLFHSESSVNFQFLNLI